MARLYSNENFPLPVVLELRRLGHDVLTINRRHFIKLHLASPAHAGILACTFDADFVGQAMRLHTAFHHEGELAGKLVRINRPP